jgi:hypothetical protein
MRFAPTLAVPLLDDGPGMTIQRRAEPPQPVDRELPFAQLEVADLLVRRAEPPGQVLERESAGLAKLAEPVGRRGIAPIAHKGCTATQVPMMSQRDPA